MYVAHQAIVKYKQTFMHEQSKVSINSIQNANFIKRNNMTGVNNIIPI